MRILGVWRCSILVGISVLLMNGCSTLPDVNTTVDTVPISTQQMDARLNRVVVSIAPVDEQQGAMPAEAEALTPMWRAGVEDALARAQTFMPGAARKVDVQVKVMGFRQSSNADLSVTTSAIASYAVVDVSSGEALWLRGISSSSTVSYQQEPVQAARERASLNNAIQGNIEQFVRLFGHGESTYQRVPDNQLRIQQ